MGRGMAWLASLALLGVLYLFFDSSLQARNNPNRQLQIAPGAELVLQRGRNGHYVFPGEINGRPVTLSARYGRDAGVRARASSR